MTDLTNELTKLIARYHLTMKHKSAINDPTKLDEIARQYYQSDPFFHAEVRALVFAIKEAINEHDHR